MQRRGTEEGTHCMSCGHFHNGASCVRCAVAEYPAPDPVPKRLSRRRRRLIREMNSVRPGWGDQMRWPA